MDLSTTWLGFELAHPFVAGASPLSDTLDGVRRLEDAGAAAIVLRSLFEEQLDSEALATFDATERHAQAFGEALTFMPDHPSFVVGPDEYLDKLRRTREAVDVPVVASLNGSTAGGWLRHATAMEQAGASAIELNVYHVPTDPMEASHEIEDRVVEMVREVRGAVRVPLAIKLSPFYTAFGHLARRLDDAGADAFVLFNRYYEPDVDVDELEHRSQLHLSDSSELLLRLRWLALISGEVQASLAVTGGVHTAFDTIKSIMAGADAVQLVSVLLARGLGTIGRLRSEVAAWLEEKEYDSLAQMKGCMNALRCPDPRSLARANYIHQLTTFDPAPYAAQDRGAADN